jgi:hypothetical protein
MGQPYKVSRRNPFLLESFALFALGKIFQERIASWANLQKMHFLGHLVLALAIIIAAMIVAFAFRFTPVVERVPGVVSGTSYDEIRSFDHWTGQHH